MYILLEILQKHKVIIKEFTKKLTNDIKILRTLHKRLRN